MDRNSLNISALNSGLGLVDDASTPSTQELPWSQPSTPEESNRQNVNFEPEVTLQAWVQVFLSHLINFNSFGFMLSFGIFQAYYTETLGFSPSNVSWIGTIELFFNFFIAIFSGPAMDAGYYKYTLVSGVSLQLIAVFTTSVCTKYWQLFLAQGVCQGIGNGLLFCPAVALVSTYFPRQKRALALSFVACGGATGGMVFPAIAQSLLPKLGFAWTVRVMGFVMLVVSLIVVPFSRPRVVQLSGRSWIDRTAFRDLPYLVYCAGIFLAFWGLFFAYYYVRSYGRDVLHTSESTSFNLLLVINSMGIPGRVIPNLLADRFFGPLRVIIPVVLTTSILIFSWIGIHSISGFYGWVAVYGFFAGGCQSLFQACAASFSDDPRTFGARIGMACTVVSFACLSGPPIAGKLIESANGSYREAQIFGASVMLASSACLFGARVLQKRSRNENALQKSPSRLSST
jgi:MFS family permease